MKGPSLRTTVTTTHQRNSKNLRFYFFRTNFDFTLWHSRRPFPICLRTFCTTWGQFHQRVYAKLLGMQILKAQKAAWVDFLFCAFGIFARKNVDEIDPRPHKTFPNVNSFLSNVIAKYFVFSDKQNSSSSIWSKKSDKFFLCDQHPLLITILAVQ